MTIERIPDRIKEFINNGEGIDIEFKTARFELGRDEIRTNLIESYDRLMAFVRKHLPDKFYQENDQRVSLRDRIFREVVGNTLIHREYMNPFPAKFIIENEKVFAENWNRPHGTGNIDPSYFSPYPKNPVIAKFFKEIGRADELGSGVRNTFKYCKLYAKEGNPTFIEWDIFVTTIPIPFISALTKVGGIRIEGTVEGALEGVIEGVTEGVKERLIMLLCLIIKNEGKRIPIYAEKSGIPEKTIECYIKRLRDANLIEFSKDEAPKVGGYYITKELFEKINQ